MIGVPGESVKAESRRVVAVPGRVARRGRPLV